jgi:hypothetical protein
MSGAADRDWIVFEWATIRVVPIVHREEFVNVGVLLHARREEFLEARISVAWERLLPLAHELDRDAIERHLAAFQSIARGEEGAGEVALLPPSERFHWLTAPRSAIIQTSERRPGRTHDLDAELERLFAEQCG